MGSDLVLVKGASGYVAGHCILRLLSKDVNGLTENNLAKVAAGDERDAILPAAPGACLALAQSEIEIEGRLVAVVSRGRTVGRPLAHMLTNRGATVIHCHSRTENLAALTSQCDILFSATGRRNLIGRNHVRHGQVLVDAGTNYSCGKVCGDVDAEAIRNIVRAYTPVPGGVGPLTSIHLFRTLIRALDLQAGGARRLFGIDRFDLSWTKQQAVIRPLEAARYRWYRRRLGLL
jgi:methylenetetrahydrofolate dehydrogenase (NADP+)/methenyltetrahydrofolate cyclohydrolase